MSIGNILAGAAFIRLLLDDAALQRSLDEAQGKLKAFAARVNAFSSQMASMAPMIAYPVVSAVKSFAAFDDQMRLTASITKATGEQFKELTDLAAKLGRETSFTAAQVASGMVSLGRMGFSPDEIKNAIKNVMDLSRSTGTELPDAAQIAANNLRVFGLEAKDMAHVADILSATANGSAQDLIDLGESLKMAGPHAKRAGADITDTAAALGILANMGIRGSLAGTALGKSYKRLADPKVREFLKQYNIETVDANNNLRSMRDIILELSKVMASMGSAEQITFAEQVFDARGALGGGTLSVNVEGIDTFLKSLDEASGYADKVAKDMDNGIGGALRRLSSAAEGFVNTIGAITAVTFGPLIESATALLGKLQEIITTDSNIVAGILKVISTFVGLGVAIKTVTILGGAIKGMLAPIAMLDAAIVGLTTAHKASAAASAASAAAQAIAKKRSIVYAAFLGKLNAVKLLGVAVSQKHAMTVLATSIADMVAAKRCATSSAIRVAGYYAEAAAAKIAAVASIGLRAALTFLASHPFMIAFLAIGTAIGVIAHQANRAKKELDDMAAAAKKAADAAAANRVRGDNNRRAAIDDMDRLRQLEEISHRTGLTAEQMKEAQDILARLDPFGASTWANIDTLTGKINLAADAQNRLNEELKKTAQADLEKEIAGLAKAIDTQKKKLKKGSDSSFGAFVDSFLSEGLGITKTISEYNAPIIEKIRALKKAYSAAANRLVDLQNGKNTKENITGNAEKKTIIADRIAAENQRRAAAAQDLAAAEKRLAEIEEQNARNRRSNVENEIHDLQKLRAEYLKNIDLLLEEEKANLRLQNAKAEQLNAPIVNKIKEIDAKIEELREKEFFARAFSQDSPELQKEADAYARQIAELEKLKKDTLANRGRGKAYEQVAAEAEKSKKKIAELEARRAAAGKDFDARKKEIYEKNEKPYSSFLDKLDADQKQKAAVSAQDDRFNQLNKDKTAEGLRLLNEFLKNLDGNLEAAKMKYQETLTKFKDEASDGGASLSSEESQQLTEMQQAITASAERLRSYRDRISDGAKQAGASHKTLAAFDASALTSIFSRSGLSGQSREERIAKATEETAKSTKKLVQYQKNAPALTVG